MKRLTTLLLLLLPFGLYAQLEDQDPIAAQEPDQGFMQNNVKLYNEKINELLDVHTGNGFRLNREQRIPMNDAVTNIINMTLEEGMWYHFVFVGDPSYDKLKVTLFKEGIGDFVQDRIKKKNKEYWTEFSFICPVTGVYEFTCFQRGDMKKPLAYLMLFDRAKNSTAKTE